MPFFSNDTKPKITELPNIVSPLDQIPSYYNLAGKPWCYDNTSSDLGNFYVNDGFFNRGNPAKNYRNDSSIINLLKK